MSSFLGKQYGLIISGKKAATKPVVGPSAFGDSSSDEEDDGKKHVNISLKRENEKRQKQTQEAAAQALAEDPSIFEYDSLYDKMTEEKEKKNPKLLKNTKPKYIHVLKKAAERRKLESELAYEHQAQREIEKDKEQFREKESFVTSGYKKKLAERKALEEELAKEAAVEEANDITKQKDLSRFHKHLFKQVVSPGGKETPTKTDQDLSSSCSDSREKENKSHREERDDKRGRRSFEGGGRRRSSGTEGRSGERVRRRSSETEGRSGERVRRRSSETEGRSGERVRRRSSETEGRSGERVRRRSSETEGRSGERVRRRSSETEGRSGERVRRRSSDRGMEGERRRSSDSRGRDEHYRERRSSNRERRDSHGRRERTPEDRRTKSALNDKTQTSTVEGVGTDEKPSSLPPPIKKMKVRAGIEIEAEEVEPVERRKQAAAKKATEETTQSAKERFLARKRARADAETRKPSVSDEQ